jgi:hypothetical protein
MPDFDLDSAGIEPPIPFSEPFLPIEKKLVGWSLGIGVGLLILLAAINDFLPLAP